MPTTSRKAYCCQFSEATSSESNELGPVSAQLEPLLSLCLQLNNYLISLDIGANLTGKCFNHTRFVISSCKDSKRTCLIWYGMSYIGDLCRVVSNSSHDIQILSIVAYTVVNKSIQASFVLLRMWRYILSHMVAWFIFEIHYMGWVCYNFLIRKLLELSVHTVRVSLWSCNIIIWVRINSTKML